MVRQAIETARTSVASGEHSSRYWCQQDSVFRADERTRPGTQGTARGPAPLQCRASALKAVSNGAFHEGRVRIPRPDENEQFHYSDNAAAEVFGLLWHHSATKIASAGSQARRQGLLWGMGLNRSRGSWWRPLK